MKTVGRAFGFYIKHWQEMEALYGNAEPKEKQALLERLTPERRNMIMAVGERADEQAAALMKECANLMERHFGNLCKVRVRGRRGNKNEWFVELRLWPDGREPKKIRLTIGISVERHGKSPALYVWLWIRGGREAEELLAGVVGKRMVKYRSRQLVDWEEGAIVIDEEPIKVREDFEVEVEAVLKRLGNVLQQFGGGKVSQLLKI
jgi:hypothetical protein